LNKLPESIDSMRLEISQQVDCFVMMKNLTLILLSGSAKK